MGQFEGEDHRRRKGVVLVQIAVCFIESKGGERGKENWADFRISASRFTCQVVQSTSESDLEHFKRPLVAL